MKEAFINGEFCPLSEAKISIFDRGFLFGDSIYEVMPIYNGHPFCLDRHLRRLLSNLEKVKIPIPIWNLKETISQIILKNGGNDLQVYLQITRGNQGIRKHDMPDDLPSSLIVFTLHNPYPTLKEREQGMSAKIVQDIRWSRCDIKTTSLLANILLNDEAISSGYDTAILVQDNLVAEGSTSNLFIVKDGAVFTPPLNHSCLPGITREVTVELIKQLNWPFFESQFSVDELLKADEVWLTNTTKEIFPIVKINEHYINNARMGSFCRLINEHYKTLVQK